MQSQQNQMYQLTHSNLSIILYFYSQLTYGNIIWVQNINTIRERRQLGFVTLNGNLAVNEWVGLVYDR